MTRPRPAAEAGWLYGPWGVLAAVALLTAWRLWQLSLNDLTLFFDEAQYWTWAKAPAFGYFSKPPVVAWLIAATTAVCGNGEACIRAGSPLVHGGTALVVYAIATYLFDRRTGFWSALSFALLPGVSFSAGIISTDVPLLFFWALATLCFARAIEAGGRGWWLACGAAVGFGLLAKYTMVLFLPCAGLYLLLTPGQRRRLRDFAPWTGLLLAGLIYLPNLVWNARHHFVSFQHTAANANLGGPLFNPGQLLEFFGAQFGVFGPLMFAALLWLVLARRHLVRAEPLRLLLWLSLPVLALMLAESLLSRAHANWAAVTYVGATVAVVGWLLRAGRPGLIYASLVLHLALAGVLYNFDALARSFAFELPAKQDPFRRVRGWDVLGDEVRAILQAHPGAVLLADEREHLVELMYYARPQAGNAVKWNPTGVIHDHYDLTTDINRVGGHDFILVTRQPGAGGIPSHFRQARRLPDLDVPVRKGYHLHYEVYLLSGFLGYDRQR